MNENIRKLLKLIQENPELPVYPMVDCEVVTGDEWGRYMGRIGDACVEQFCRVHGGQVFYYNPDNWGEILTCLEVDGYITDDYSNEECLNLYKNDLHWTKGIIVEIDV